MASAQEKIAPEAYTGVAIGTGGSLGGKSIGFDFRITSYTTDEEVQTFAQLLKDKGQDPLTSALNKENKGSINLAGSTETPARRQDDHHSCDSSKDVFRRVV
jgi:hypothetical protein